MAEELGSALSECRHCGWWIWWHADDVSNWVDHTGGALCDSPYFFTHAPVDPLPDFRDPDQVDAWLTATP